MQFNLTSPYQPTGDQPNAIQQLVEGINRQDKAQTLLGVTGSGKTFTIANLIQEVKRPTLIISHNKTLAAQLYAEFSSFFPNNAVEYFVSYYDYYQPEAYLPTTDVYIEKELTINAEIEKLRLRTASSLLSGRRDVIVVSSVSCIYGLSNPADFGQHVLFYNVGDIIDRDEFLLQLVDLLYHRNEESFGHGSFRVRGDTVDVFLAYGDQAYRFFFFGDEIEAIQEIDPEKGTQIANLKRVSIYPANLFVTSKSSIDSAILEIEKELIKQVRFFLKEGKTEEAERLEERTKLDIDMMKEIGYCSGIENYSRFFDKRQPGQRPYCLLDYFPTDFLLVIDESHVTIPQLRGMWGGDHARKRHLVDYGFRIPAAMDNRPLNFQEFESLRSQVVYVSATPSSYELEDSGGLVVEQLIRPTGLLDPKITIVPTKHQIDHLLDAIQGRIKKKERVLITTLTKKMAEELSKYLLRVGVRCRYIHSEIKTLERVTILEGLRIGEFDVLVGVNLLREGLDLPEVSLVAIINADKEGFLRNTSSLIQTIGRAARNVNGEVFMYADIVTKSMKQAIQETERRRIKQIAYNDKYGITPTSVHQAKQNLLQRANYDTASYRNDHQKEVADPETSYDKKQFTAKDIQKIERQMEEAAKKMDYVEAERLKNILDGLSKQSRD
ncbi:MAG: excinuclease ABC subunit UvrB [Bacteroidota bacterium]